MIPQDRNFYRAITPFKTFEEFNQDRHYRPAPLDWWVMISDIRGSTQAIATGRYQDVNTAGATTIAALLNALPSEDLPYVFGGDGATFLLPSHTVEVAKSAARATKAFVEKHFGFQLRIGFVPISWLAREGKSVEVAKHELSHGNYLAFFRGGGIQRAEEWIKNGGPNGESCEIDLGGTEPGPPNLEGLSCRWKPLPARRGMVVTLLVLARTGEASPRTYDLVLEVICKNLPFDMSALAPTGETHFRPQWPGKSWRFESAWSSDPKGGRLGLLKTQLKHLAFTLLVNLSLRLNFFLGKFNPKKYKGELKANSDFRKFDDMLRIVLDCREDEIIHLRQALESLRAQGSIFFGMHTSPTALMTCLVFSPTENRHVHFIDGSHGGYAAAATELKRQMKSQITAPLDQVSG